MQIDMVFRVEVEAKAKSSYTREHVERRIEALQLQPPTQQRDDELTYLAGILSRDFSEEALSG
jgi:hypothetical protein